MKKKLQIFSLLKKNQSLKGNFFGLLRLSSLLLLLTTFEKASAQFDNEILNTSFANLPTVSSSASTVTVGTGAASGYSWIRTTINNTTTTWPYIGVAGATNITTVVIGTSTSTSYLELPPLDFSSGGTLYIDYGSGSNREYELQDATSGSAVYTGISGGNGSAAYKFQVDNTTAKPRNTILNCTFTLAAANFNGSKKLRIAFTGGSDSRIFKVIVKTTGVTPVTFANVKAYQKNTGIQIDWSTASEINMDKFAIEKSADGINYTTATSLNARGSNTALTNYNWYDAAPNNGSNFYRIKAIEKDGSFKYSNTLKVAIGKTKTDIAIAPNPVKDAQLNLQISSLEKGSYTVKAISTAGQVISTKLIAHEGGSAAYTIGLPATAKAGLYTLLLQNESTKITKQFMVQ